MCNCGNEGATKGRSARQAVTARSDSGPPTRESPRSPAAGPTATAVPFGRGATIEPRRFVDMVYVGATALTALGPVTQTRYRFDRPGAHLRVDARDAPALTAVPKLRLA